MHRRTREFKWAHHPKLHPGWIPVNAADGFYPGNGFIAAHDTIEHMSDKTDWAHELRATGVAVFSEPGMNDRSFGSIVEDILSFAASDHELAAPDAPAFANNPLPPQHERRLQKFLAVLALDLREGIERADAAHAEVPPVARANAPTFAKRAEPWIRLGYRAALRVYGDNPRSVGAMMIEAKNAINIDHDKLRPVVGDTLTVSVDTKALSFSIKRGGTNDLNAEQRRSRNAREIIDRAFAGLATL